MHGTGVGIKVRSSSEAPGRQAASSARNSKELRKYPQPRQTPESKARGGGESMCPGLESQLEATAKRRGGKPQAPRKTTKNTASIHNRARLVQDLNPCADRNRRVLRRAAFPAATLKQAIPLAAPRPTRAPARPRASDRLLGMARPGMRARQAVLNVGAATQIRRHPRTWNSRFEFHPSKSPSVGVISSTRIGGQHD